MEAIYDEVMLDGTALEAMLSAEVDREIQRHQAGRKSDSHPAGGNSVGRYGE